MCRLQRKLGLLHMDRMNVSPSTAKSTRRTARYVHAASSPDRACFSPALPCLLSHNTRCTTTRISAEVRSVEERCLRLTTKNARKTSSARPPLATKGVCRLPWLGKLALCTQPCSHMLVARLVYQVNLHCPVRCNKSKGSQASFRCLLSIILVHISQHAFYVIDVIVRHRRHLAGAARSKFLRFFDFSNQSLSNPPLHLPVTLFHPV